MAIKDLADLAGIPESSARRYARLFSQFLPHKALGRVVRYDPDCVNILVEISSLYNVGMDTERIADTLATKYPVMLEYDADDESHELSPAPTGRGTLAVALEQVAAAMEMVVKQQEEIHQLREEVSDLRDAQAHAEQEMRQAVAEAGVALQKGIGELEGRLSRVEARKARKRWWWPFSI